MKKLFTLFVLLACFLGAKAVVVVDAEVDFTQMEDCDGSAIKLYSWGGTRDYLSIQNGCLHFHSDAETDDPWGAQFFPIGGVSVEVGVTYTIEFKIKGSVEGPFWNIGFAGVPKYNIFTVPTEWTVMSFEYEATAAEGDACFQCGKYVGDWDIEYIKITHEEREQKPVTWVNMLENGDAATAWANPNLKTSDEGWEKVCAWSKEYKRRDPEDATKELVHPADIEDGVFVCKADEVNPPLVWEEAGEQWGQKHEAGDPKPDNSWQNQFWIVLPRALKDGEPYKVSFKYKASEAARVTTQNHKNTPGDYLDGGQVGELKFSTEWQTYESKELSASANMTSIAFNFGEDKQYEKDITFYFDDINVSLMQLKEGFFVAGINTDEGGTFTGFNFDNAIELEKVADEENEGQFLYVGVIGGDEKDSWVNQVMISTRYGHDKGFKANTIKVTKRITSSETAWPPYVESANTATNLPALGKWQITVAPADDQINFVKLVGEEEAQPVDIVENKTVAVLNAVERDFTASEQPANDAEGVVAGTGNPWDSQFWIVANRNLKAGEETVVEFDYVASIDDAKTGTQTQKENFTYLGNNAIGDVTFGTTEAHFKQDFTVKDDGMLSIVFNMATIKAACDYTIKNVKWYLKDADLIKENKTMENLIDAEGTANFFLKEGVGYEIHQAGTDPVPPTGITNVVKNVKTSAVIYNLAGQRVSNGFKGIVIKDGKKYVK